MNQDYTDQNPFLKLLLRGFLVYAVVKIADELLEENEGEQKTKPRLFFSHAWKYGYHYDILVDKLVGRNFDFYDHSIPEYKKLNARNASEIRRGIFQKIRGCSAVIISAGMYANSYWIKEEIRMAKQLRKRIIAVSPRGAKRIPSYLNDGSIEIIGSYAPKLIETLKCY
jgi:hypothetical protein